MENFDQVHTKIFLPQLKYGIGIIKEIKFYKDMV